MTAEYEQILERLYKTGFKLGMRMGLEVARALDAHLGAPTSQYPTVHVAGSNGKGSVTTKIARALELSGYRVGLYTSPHLFSFRERITINGALIPEEEVIRGLQQIFALDDQFQWGATFFECTTFLALGYFRQMQVDVAIIETGLGGRLDATNLIHPLLSVITSISREHRQWLGEEIEEIAAEKAGIIKKNVPVILGPKARCQAIYDRAKEMDSPIYASRKISYFYDEENSAVAALALTHLAPHFAIDPGAVHEALKMRPPCRFERIGDVILDVAHNPDAIFSLLQALHTFFPERKFRFLVGFSRDKEYDRCLELIADVATHIHLVCANSERAATQKELMEALKNEDPQLFTAHASIKEGVKAACAEGEILVICGSFYIMAEARRALGDHSPKDSFDLSEKIFPPALSPIVS